ncbi:hypothetical protein KEM56_006492 [Ascosphaera pollenicola]|nr:hypothetical protein KEM56_006492 [Ascosphaera pollenicola]
MESPKGRRHRLPADVQDSEVIRCVHRNTETPFERDQFWKVNIEIETALSQHYNLYFVASRDCIYVFRPHGPHIGAEPDLILKIDLVKPDARGLSAIGGAHAINHLITGDLGTDEILLFATDSGNIGAYFIDKIASVIDDLEELGDEKKCSLEAGQRVRCFFVEFVRSSAWGLAIHTHSRMIAVSANDHNIHVFAFALQLPKSWIRQGYESLCQQNVLMINAWDEAGWPLIHHTSQLQEFMQVRKGLHRLTNLRLQYSGHMDNIPSVSFLGAADQELQYMVSVDITNKICIWFLWGSLAPIRMIDMSLISPPIGMVDRDQRGWAVLALDPRSFRTKSCLNIACPGGKSPLTYEGVQGRGLPKANREMKSDADGIVSDEINKVLGRTKREQPPKPPCEKLKKLWEKPLDFPGPFLGTNPNSRMASDEDVEMEDAQLVEQEASGNLEDTSADHEDNRYRVDWDLDPKQLELLDEYFEQHYLDHYHPPFMDTPPEHLPTPASVHWDDDWKDPFANFPIAHFAEASISLFRGAGSIHATTVYDDVFYVDSDHRLPFDNQWKRINMVHQISELGLVIAATQRGRVGIFTMTDVPFEGPTLRLDHLIPARDDKPYESPLLGVAVGPVESQLDPPTGKKEAANRGNVLNDNWKSRQHPFRRYRLIMYYYDQRIDHYELWYDWPDDMRGPMNKWKPNEGRWLLVKDVVPGDN